MPVAGAASGVIADHFYVAGGHDASGAVIDIVWDYSIGTDTWAARASMPTPRNAPGSAVGERQALDLRRRGFGEPDRDTTAYDPGADSWSRAEPERASRVVGERRSGTPWWRRAGTTARPRLAPTEVLAAGAASCADPTTTFSENFDGVTPPALPAGWTATNVQGPAPLWTTSNTGMPTPPFDTPPNAAFVDNPQVVSDKRLDSPSIPIATAPLSSPSATTTTPRPRSTAECWRSASAAAPSRTSAPREAVSSSVPTAARSRQASTTHSRGASPGPATRTTASSPRS